jgi:site-specific recombinase XerD
MQEALHRDLGKMKFTRAFPKRRLPTVLSREECFRLFAEMEGTERLMAELAYGAGLRLMELLRLRVHHVDLERQRLQVFGGKGDRVKGFANAADQPQFAGNALRLCAAVGI